MQAPKYNLLPGLGQLGIHNILLGGTNDIDPLVPEIWAQESLMLLEEYMIAALMVRTDYKDEIAKFGQTVNIDRPARVKAKRKTVADNVTVQDADAEQIPVKLNQHVHVSILIKDGEESMAFKDLAAYHLKPMILAHAQFIDKVILGQYAQFLENTFGGLGTLSSSNSESRIIGLRKVMQQNLAHTTGRQLIWSTDGAAQVIGTDKFTSADKRGDGGQALREASMGRILGFDHYECQNMASVGDADKTSSVALINLAAGYAAGTTTFVTDTGAAAIANNTFITIDGDNTPLRVVSTTGGATPTAITVAAPGLRAAVANNAIVTKFIPGTTAAAYGVGYSKELTYAGFTIEPQVGQMVTFGLDPTSPVYVVIDVDTDNNTITLDRPLTVAVANGGACNLGPSGNYNFAFHRDAIALVTRPLAAPKAGTGALSAVINYNGFSIRATITYDGNKQGHLITLDLIFGIAILEEELGAVLLG